MYVPLAESLLGRMGLPEDWWTDEEWLDLMSGMKCSAMYVVQGVREMLRGW